ncbi:MAG: peptide deformylase [Deltaproteobacteria bacterium]|nr:peptide deformylase [Deltaproteobacteria bacterium]
MALLPVLTVPDPLLTAKARPVRPDEFGPDLVQRVHDMAETMYAAPGVGLAAPQVGDLRRFLVCDPGGKLDPEGRMHGERLLVLINPVLVEVADEIESCEEGCLSVPGFWETVVRPSWARVRFQDESGSPHEVLYEGYPAVVVQHEIDHLDGVLILDHVSRLKRSRYLRARAKAKQKA